MKKGCWLLALASVFVVSKSQAISLDAIQLWTGAGTNRAALVIQWNTPELINDSTVPAPVANKNEAAAGSLSMGKNAFCNSAKV